jgi:hypothetical protein
MSPSFQIKEEIDRFSLIMDPHIASALWLRPLKHFPTANLKPLFSSFSLFLIARVFIIA